MSKDKLLLKQENARKKMCLIPTDMSMEIKGNKLKTLLRSHHFFGHSCCLGDYTSPYTKRIRNPQEGDWKHEGFVGLRISVFNGKEWEEGIVNIDELSENDIEKLTYRREVKDMLLKSKSRGGVFVEWGE